MSDIPSAPAEAGGVTTEQPVLLALLGHWEALRGERGFVRRQDLDPAGMRQILENVMVIGVEDPPAGAGAPARPLFRYRLIGTGLTVAAGYDLTGASFDDLPDRTFGGFCQTLFERAVVLGTPISATGRRRIGGAQWAFDSIVLPLSQDGGTVDAFLAALVYPGEWNRGRQPRPPWNWHAS